MKLVFSMEWRPPVWLAALISAGLVVLFGWFNYLTDRSMSFQIFFLIPIGIGSWYGNGYIGVATALASGIVCYFNEGIFPIPAEPIHPGHIGSFSVKMPLLMLAAWLFLRLRKALEAEELMAMTDPLTGAANSRVLFDLATYEMKGMLRTGRPLSIAFMDVDDLKKLNDSQGHKAGDEFLKALVLGLRSSLRAQDTVARVGGDEFVLLLPGADDKQAAEIMDRARESLSRQLAVEGYKTTMSMGLVTCQDCPRSPDELVRMADDLMYRVKKSGKGGIIHEVVLGGYEEGGHERKRVKHP